MLPFQVSPSPESISLLLVEDDVNARELTSLSLGIRFPFLRLYQAANGEEGVDLYEKKRPDIVLTDLSMPMMDGVTMAQQILAMDGSVQIIFVSGHSEVPSLEKSVELGVKRYVLKPVEHEPLFDAVWECVKGVQLRRELQKQAEQATEIKRQEV